MEKKLKIGNILVLRCTITWWNHLFKHILRKSLLPRLNFIYFWFQVLIFLMKFCHMIVSSSPSFCRKLAFTGNIVEVHEMWNVMCSWTWFMNLYYWSALEVFIFIMDKMDLVLGWLPGKNKDDFSSLICACAPDRHWLIFMKMCLYGTKWETVSCCQTKSLGHLVNSRVIR